MPKILNVRLFVMFLVIVVFSGCSSNQSLKDAWKTTRVSWYTHASPKASIDYDDTGDMTPDQIALSSKMVGIDIQLIKLERIMLNGDKAPTGEWISKLFETAPWITGFAGVRANGEILGQEPAGFLDNYDVSPLLQIDEKQPMRNLRAIVVSRGSDLPEVLLATPLYESSDFLGVVIASFNMNSLLSYSNNSNGIIIFTPQILLWGGGFEQNTKSLVSLDWENITKKEVTGNISLGSNSYYWVVRFLGNLPIIFAVPHINNIPNENLPVIQDKEVDAVEVDAVEVDAVEVDAPKAEDSTQPSTNVQ